MLKSYQRLLYQNQITEKTILCPCDDPEWSNFTKYFAQNFQRLGIKKLISTSYAIESKIYIGQIYMNEFDDDEISINYHQKLYDEYPFIPDILYTLVQSYAKAGKNEDARDILKLWISSHPNDSQAMDWLSILSTTE